MDIISRSTWRSIQRYVICFSRDNIIFPDKNLLSCDMIVSRSIYVVLYGQVERGGEAKGG